MDCYLFVCCRWMRWSAPWIEIMTAGLVSQSSGRNNDLSREGVYILCRYSMYSLLCTPLLQQLEMLTPRAAAGSWWVASLSLSRKTSGCNQMEVNKACIVKFKWVDSNTLSGISSLRSCSECWQVVWGGQVGLLTTHPGGGCVLGSSADNDR